MHCAFPCTGNLVSFSYWQQAYNSALGRPFRFADIYSERQNSKDGNANWVNNLTLGNQPERELGRGRIFCAEEKLNHVDLLISSIGRSFRELLIGDQNAGADPRR